MHAHYTARQILQGSRHMFSASEPTLYYHIQGPKSFRSPIYAYFNHCNASQPAGTMTILCMLTILLGKHCRGHAECSRPRTQHYIPIFDDRTHSGLTFMHTVTTAIPINLPKKMTILCILTILLGKYCRAHAECSRPRTEHYTTISSGRNHSGVKFMHTVTTAMPVKLPEQWPFYACSL